MTLQELRKSKDYPTDKRSYLPVYEELFGGMRGAPVQLLELGVLNGGSLQLWRDYFPVGMIYGVDDKPELDLGERIVTLRHHVADEARLRQFCAAQFSGMCFDIVIDDAGHRASQAAAAFRVLFAEYLEPGGLYCIEDWGVGYRQGWPESAGGMSYPTPVGARCGDEWPSHQGGMAGLVKQLVDGCHWPERTGIEWLRISKGLAVIRKGVGTCSF